MMSVYNPDLTTGVNLLNFFCSGIQFNLLLSHYLCFISLLYLDLNVLGDDALISKGSFMQTKYLYSNKNETPDFHGTVSFDLVKMLQQKTQKNPICLSNV